uniref:Protein sleepless n=1 Tax=Cacopsylla melanoneura TaxID=428564 RepID=A0A8D8LE12_9HEMI
MLKYIYTIFILIYLYLPGGLSINCYSCSSTNGSDVHCEDPFNSAVSIFTEKCMVPKQGHIGLFPAHFCIKIVGRNVDTYAKMVIRACVIKNMDSQCGEFKFEDQTMTGCVLTCDFDGCNRVSSLYPSSLFSLLSLLFLVQNTIIV